MLYYISSSGNEFEIVRCDLFGENREVLYQASGIASNLTILNGDIYFLLDGKILLISEAGQTRVISSSEDIIGRFMPLIGGMIYTTQEVELVEEDLYSYQGLWFLENSEEHLIARDVGSFDLHNNSVYFTLLIVKTVITHWTN